MSNSRQFIILFTKKCIAHDDGSVPTNKLPPVKYMQEVLSEIIGRTGVKKGFKVTISTTVSTKPAEYVDGLYENTICIAYDQIVPELIYVYTYNDMSHLDELKKVLDVVAASTKDTCEYGKSELFDGRVLIPIDNTPLFEYLCGLEVDRRREEIKAAN